MNERALIGRYLERSSPVHRLDPRVKLLAALVVIAALLVAGNWWSLMSCAVFIVGFYAAAEIAPLSALRSVAPLLFIVIITALLNIFFVQGGDVYVSWGPMQISAEGVHAAAFMSARLVLLLLGVSLLTLTTTNLDITEAFERLLSPTHRLGVPAHELAMIMGIALRFLPLFAGELTTIRRAQIARGGRFTLWPPAAGLRSLSALLVPLFASAFRHSDTLAEAMEARCYHGALGRTRLHPLRLGLRDAIAGMAVCAMLATAIVITVCIP